MVAEGERERERRSAGAPGRTIALVAGVLRVRD